MAPKKPKVFKAKSNSHKVFDPKLAWAKLYDKDWQAYRLRFLKHNPRCYVCEKPATVVDHLQPARGDVELFEKLTNHAPFCASHHNTVTAKFDRFHSTGKSIEKKLQWMSDQRLKNGVTLRIKVLPSYR